MLCIFSGTLSATKLRYASYLRLLLIITNPRAICKRFPRDFGNLTPLSCLLGELPRRFSWLPLFLRHDLYGGEGRGQKGLPFFKGEAPPLAGVVGIDGR